MKIEVTSTTTNHIQGTSPKSGKSYSFHTQQAYVHGLTENPYPDAFEIVLDRDRDGKPYPKGMYQVDPKASFKVFGGRLNFNPVLKPLPESK